MQGSVEYESWPGLLVCVSAIDSRGIHVDVGSGLGPDFATVGLDFPCDCGQADFCNFRNQDSVLQTEKCRATCVLGVLMENEKQNEQIKVPNVLDTESRACATTRVLVRRSHPTPLATV